MFWITLFARNTRNVQTTKSEMFLQTFCLNGHQRTPIRSQRFSTHHSSQTHMPNTSNHAQTMFLNLSLNWPRIFHMWLIMCFRKNSIRSPFVQPLNKWCNKTPPPCLALTWYFCLFVVSPRCDDIVIIAWPCRRCTAVGYLLTLANAIHRQSRFKYRIPLRLLGSANQTGNVLPESSFSQTQFIANKECITGGWQARKRGNAHVN